MNERKDYREKVMKLFLILCLILPFGISAQDLMLKGHVIDQNGEAVIGASVIQKGTNNGVATDINGDFQLKVPANATIVVSYIGYATQLSLIHI